MQPVGSPVTINPFDYKVSFLFLKKVGVFPCICFLHFLNRQYHFTIDDYYIKIFYTFNYLEHTTNVILDLKLSLSLPFHINPRDLIIYEGFKPQSSKSLSLEKTLKPLPSFSGMCLSSLTQARPTSLLLHALTTKQNFHAYCIKNTVLSKI